MLRELWSSKPVRTNLIGACIVWSVSMFNFYLITFYLKYFSGDIFENSLLFALSDLVAYIVSGYILKKATTTKTLLISYSTSLTGAVLLLFFFNNLTMIPILIILSRVGITMSFNTVYISNSRLFPTKFLASTYGIANLISHLLAVLAPIVAEVPNPYPMLLFCILIGVAMFASLFLKELNNGKDSDSKLEKD